MSRFAALDGLRGVSAIAVVLFHAPIAFHLFDSPLVREAYNFVDFFFVLSGFVIAHAYGDRLATGTQFAEYMLRRVARLWPLHLVTLAAALAVEIAIYLSATRLGIELRPSFVGERSLTLLLPNALLLHGWAPLIMSWNAPSWSISAEFLAYIIFGMVMVLARSRTTMVGATILGLAWFVSLSLAPDDAMYAGLPGLRAVCGFFAGVLMHRVFTQAGRPNWSMALATSLEIAAVISIAAFLVFVSRKETTPWVTPVFAATVYIFAAERGALSRLLKASLPQLLGRLSYSIYLTHAVLISASILVFMIAGEALGLDLLTPAQVLYSAAVERGIDWLVLDIGSPWANDLLVGAQIAIVICVSMVTYRRIELPGQIAFRSLGERPRPNAEATTG
jgi:peptidoglycan/LPS O-acetylase OafA/YrhL